MRLDLLYRVASGRGGSDAAETQQKYESHIRKKKNVDAPTLHKAVVILALEKKMRKQATRMPRVLLHNCRHPHLGGSNYCYLPAWGIP